MTTAPDDDLVPLSVRLGQVVPPEDPEDWTRPLTWVAALGMLAAPAVALVWFVAARPTSGDREPMTALLAATLATGAAATGATQLGSVRAFAGTLGAGLFGALGTIVVGAVLAGERQLGSAPPPLAHAVMAALAGIGGAAGAAAVAAALAPMRSRLARAVPALGAGVAVALLALNLLPA